MTCRTEPPTAPTAKVLRMSRRDTELSLIVPLPMGLPLSSGAVLARLQVALLGFVEQIVGRAPSEGHDRKSGIFVRVGDKGRAIHDENIFHVMGLAVAVQHGGLRI